MNITVTTDDEFIERLLVQASSDIESYTKRKLRARAYDDTTFPSEIHSGEGSNQLFTDQFPIISVSALYDDSAHSFGSATLKTSTDYLIFKDQGIIQLYNDAVLGTVFGKSVGNIRLKYVAGYDQFNIIANVNNKLDFEETSSTEKTASITAGVYTGSGLATVIESGLEAVGDSDYSVTYDYRTSLFKITSDRAGGGNTFKLLTNTGTNVYRSIAMTIGFVTSADNDDAATQEADFNTLGIPHDLIKACNILMAYEFKRSDVGAGSLGEKSIQSKEGTVMYDTDDLPNDFKRILNSYKRHLI